MVWLGLKLGTIGRIKVNVQAKDMVRFNVKVWLWLRLSLGLFSIIEFSNCETYSCLNRSQIQSMVCRTLKQNVF